MLISYIWTLMDSCLISHHFAIFFFFLLRTFPLFLFLDIASLLFKSLIGNFINDCFIVFLVDVFLFFNFMMPTDLNQSMILLCNWSWLWAIDNFSRYYVMITCYLISVKVIHDSYSVYIILTNMVAIAY